MATPAAQIHALGSASVFPSSKLPSSRVAASNSLFFGVRRPGSASGARLSARRRSQRSGYGPLRVVCEKVVGIDLGTTNSAVAAMEGGKPTIVTNAEGQRTTPSVVAYTKNGDRLVGQIAKRQAVVNPENTFFSVKRFIGRKMSEVDEESKQVSYRVLRDENGNVKLDCPAIGKQFAAEEISAQVMDFEFYLQVLPNRLIRLMPLSCRTANAYVLRKLVDDASKFLNDKVTKAVVTVPAYFNDSQRTATKDAGRIAGLEVLRIINEPTAASLAYGFEKKSNETILVFDLGGGTFDVSGVLAGDVSDIVLLDVTPLSLGLETLGGVMTKIIPRNTTLPTSKSEVFSTAADGQTSVEINVLQGEREFVRDNKSLGSFRLDGIPPAPRGVPQIEVKFDIDANGILSVTAVDKGTGKKQDITITGASTLPTDEVERMVKEAEKFAKEDKEKRDAIDTKNQSESVIYQTEKQLKELGDKVPAAVKEKVEGKLKDLKDVVAGGSTQSMKDAMAALNQEVMQLGQSLYNQQGAAGAGPGAGAAPGADAGSSGPSSKGPENGDVIDADFTDSN
ncbi:hypothetical protein B296_00036454 [Ensete ventricosum]|uniref:Uncharacterized protein n=1 Tax=Ensete ventricosum TaxID=4639 RepID=A0A427A2M7_ENSVE|nr:hypothetical protein B296_00036454 [Ensete ventricosum]